MKLVIGLNPAKPDLDLIERDGDLVLNLMGVLRLTREDISQFILEAIEKANARAGGVLQPNTSPQQLEDDLSRVFTQPEFGLSALDMVRDGLASFQAAFHGSPVSSWLPSRYEQLPPQGRWSVVRYGNIELQALENYLDSSERVRTEMSDIVKSLSSEEAMYKGTRQRNHFSGDDVEYNLRRLMTNAGFYVQSDEQAAWDAFEFWAKSYLDGMTNGLLAAYPPAYPFFFKVRRVIWERSHFHMEYVQHPWMKEFYEIVAGKRIVFISPLAHLADQQVRSGRIKELYYQNAVPDFALFPVQAPVSTWPNRPHNDWIDSFNKLAANVDDVIQESRAEVVVASCGCYGIPICSYAFRRHPVSVLYIGNIVHKFFGIRQKSTFDINETNINNNAWVDGNLLRHANIDRIDNGRYT